MKKWLLLLFSVFLLSGCSAFNIEKIPACEEGYHLEDGYCLLDEYSDITISSGSNLLDLYHSFQKKYDLAFYNSRVLLFEDVAMEKVDAYNSEGSNDYSETNNQVEGVDEMDNVLTDGMYLYVANYNKIQIMLAYTNTDEYNALSMVKEISFEDLAVDNEQIYFNGMYVDDDRLLLIASYYENNFCIDNYDENIDSDSNGSYCEWSLYRRGTVVYEYSKTDFSLVNQYRFSGYYVGSRKIGDDLYIVTNEYLPYYAFEENPEIIDSYLPFYNVNDLETSLSYSDIIYNEGTNPTTFTAFYGISLDTKEVDSEVVLGDGGYNLYVSLNNIYLTGTKYNYNEVILRKIDEALDKNDVDYVPEENPMEISTSIIRVAIENGSVGIGAIGEVEGATLDQFSMDEYGGFVRIVTTENNWWWNFFIDNTIDNRLYILDLNLNVLSMLDGIGKEGESVQAVRFVGDYAYVVTFLKTDPFYVIDLHDPLNPKKLSELVMPGFSDYLQTLNENYMLGIGYGDSVGGTQGLKITLYDISDKHNATIADEIVYPYADNKYIWTSTVYNHKDLLVALNKGIIALPYTENSWDRTDNDWRWSYQTGILVLNIDLDAGQLSERGKVVHSETNNYDTYVYKSKYIDNYLYTISSKFVKVSTIDNPNVILNELMIGESEYIDFPSVEVDPS